MRFSGSATKSNVKPYFARASRGVVLRIEKQHDRLALEVPEVDRDAVLVRPLEIGRSGAGLKQVAHRPPSNRPSHFNDCPAPSGGESLDVAHAENRGQSFRISRAAL